MAEFFATVQGAPVARAELSVPYAGVWILDLELHEPAALSGLVTATIGDSTFKGTVDPTATGEFLAAQEVRILGGAAGWQKVIPARGEHNDAGLKRSRLLQEVARKAGETLAALPSDIDAPGLGIDYARAAGPASRSFSRLLGARLWWVDFAGVTHVGNRVADSVPADVELLDYAPGARFATLGLDHGGSLVPGMVLRDARLTRPLEVRDLQVTMGASRMRAKASVRELSS